MAEDDDGVTTYVLQVMSYLTRQRISPSYGGAPTPALLTVIFLSRPT